MLNFTVRSKKLQGVKQKGKVSSARHVLRTYGCINIFQGMRVAMVPRPRISVQAAKIANEMRNLSILHEHNLPMQPFSRSRNSVEVRSQAVKLLTRGCFMVRRSDPSVPANRDYRLC